jgi:hypothetical protein
MLDFQKFSNEVSMTTPESALAVSIMALPELLVSIMAESNIAVSIMAESYLVMSMSQLTTKTLDFVGITLPW